MNIPKKYFHDRLVLLLVSINGFLTVLSSLLIILNLRNSHSNVHLVQYHSDLGRLSATKYSNASAFIGFILFAFFIMIFNTILSIRTYQIRRQFSVAILASTLLVLILFTLVTNALLFNNR